MRKKRRPSRLREGQPCICIIAALFAVTSPACDQHISGDVKPYAITVHTIQMLDYGLSRGEIAKAVRAPVAEPLPNYPLVFLSIDPDRPILRESSAQCMEEHANKLVSHVRFSAPRCGAQLAGGVRHFSSPSSHPNLAPPWPIFARRSGTAGVSVSDRAVGEPPERDVAPNDSCERRQSNRADGSRQLYRSSRRREVAAGYSPLCWSSFATSAVQPV